MGLFDGYYDSGTYQGGGNLIDRLVQQLTPQSQYQPSAGFAPSPMDANASAPAPAAVPQASPIGVGDYQMPRVGAASGFTLPPPHDPMTGQTIAPATAAPVAQPAFLQPQHSPGGFGGVMRGAMANAQGGILGMLGGAFAGGMGMGQGTEQDQRTRSLKAQYDALVPILGPQKAQLAVINPEIGKTMVAQALGPQNVTPLGNGYVWDPRAGKAVKAYDPEDKFKVVQTGENGIGGKQFEVFNPADGSHVPIKSAASADAAGSLGDMTLTGKGYLASIPPAQRGTVQGMAEGTIPPPSSFALTKPYWQNMIAAAKNYDPSFDTTQWGGRVAGVKDFSAGKSSEMVRSANQTIGHIGDLIGKMDALNNGDYPLKNKIGNYLSTSAGGAAVIGFKQNAHAVADELSKVFKGAGISDHEIKQWEENLSPDMSPAQQHEAVTTAMSLLQHSLSALEEKRLNSIGPMAAEKAGPLLKPDAQAAVDRIQKWAAGKAAEAAAAPAQTKTGVTWSVVQ